MIIIEYKYLYKIFWRCYMSYYTFLVMEPATLVLFIIVFIFFEAIPSSIIIYCRIRIKNSESWDELDAELVDKVKIYSSNSEYANRLHSVLRISLNDGTFVKYTCKTSNYGLNSRIGTHFKVRYKRINNKDNVYIPGQYTNTFLIFGFFMIVIAFLFGAGLYFASGN